MWWHNTMQRVMFLAVCSAILLASGIAQGVQIALEPVASGLAFPTYVTHAGDGSGRLFIVLRQGQIVIFDGIRVRPTPFLDITPLVSTAGEQGLFSVAFHPNYSQNGLFFVNYTNLSGATVVARYSVSGDPNVANPASAQVLLTIAQPFTNHNGGQLQFGPDGFLYIGMGDGGSGGDPFNNAQNLATLLGKMLRIDVNGGIPYAIPLNNPFIGVPGARGEIWALGLRNPWRFSFDRLTGDLFIADVGQNRFEEVDFQSAASAGGENYGWRLMEGLHCFIPTINCNDGTLTLPIIEYDHSLGKCSITGGYRYRGVQQPGLFGIYFFADLCTGQIWGASQDGLGVWSFTELLDTALMIATFGEDEAGELYVADFMGGTVFRIVTAPLTAIELLLPDRQAVLTSPPVFVWSADGGVDNAFAVDLSMSPTGPFSSTFDNLNIVIRGNSWAMPAGIWERVASGSRLFWRVRGADLAEAAPAIVTSAETQMFFKQ